MGQNDPVYAFYSFNHIFFINQSVVIECMRNRTTSYVKRNITSREKKVYAQHTTFYVN